MKKGISVKCANCGETTRFGVNDGGLPCECPKCGNKAVVPFPGMGRAAYFGWKALKMFAFTLFAQAGDAAFMIGIIPSIVFSLMLAYQRGINIGHRPVTTCLIGLIPGSFFYFIGMPTGELKKKQKPAIQPMTDDFHKTTFGYKIFAWAILIVFVGGPIIFALWGLWIYIRGPV